MDKQNEDARNVTPQPIAPQRAMASNPETASSNPIQADQDGPAGESMVHQTIIVPLNDNIVPDPIPESPQPADDQSNSVEPTNDYGESITPVDTEILQIDAEPETERATPLPVQSTSSDPANQNAYPDPIDSPTIQVQAPPAFVAPVVQVASGKSSKRHILLYVIIGLVIVGIVVGLVFWKIFKF